MQLHHITDSRLTIEACTACFGHVNNLCSRMHLRRQQRRVTEEVHCTDMILPLLSVELEQLVGLHILALDVTTDNVPMSQHTASQRVFALHSV